MKLLIALFFSCLIQFSWGQNAVLNQVDSLGHKQGHWQKKTVDGRMVYDGYFQDNKPVGTFKRYGQSGMLKAKLNYQEKSDSVKAILFDSKGRPMARGTYLKEKKCGQWNYFKDGKLVNQEHYRNGLKEGKAITYYPDGAIFEKTVWKDGRQNGIYQAFFPSGKVYLECRMVNDKRDGVCHVYYSSGNLEIDAAYHQGLRSGKWMYYNNDGNLAYVLNYQNGDLLNPQVLDSVEQIDFKQIDAKKGTFTDPDQFMNNPFEYQQKAMQKMHK